MPIVRAAPEKKVHGEVAIFEQTKVTLAAQFDGPMATSKPGKWVLTYTDSGGGKTTKDVAVTVSAARASATHDLTLPDVADGKEWYLLTYALQLDGEPKPMAGTTEYKVWPLDLTIKPTQKDPDQKGRFRFDLYETGKEVQEGLMVREADKLGAVRLKVPGRAVIVARSPWVISSWAAGAEFAKLRACTVERNKWVASVYAPNDRSTTAESPLRWYVNFPAGDSCGSTIAVKLGAREDEGVTNGPRVACLGDELFFRVTFGKDNSPRTSPPPGVFTGAARVRVAPKSAARPLVFEGKVLLDEQGQGALSIDLGVAGGDRCTIEVGAGPEVKDQTLHVQTWRYVGLDHLIGQDDMRRPCPGVLEDGAALPAAGFMSALQTALDPLFIELLNLEARSKTFSADDITTACTANRAAMDGTAMVWASDFINIKGAALPPDEKVLVMPSVALFSLGKLQHPSKDPQSVLVRWCDLISDKNEARDYFVAEFEAADPKTVETSFHIFPVDILEADGGLGIKKIQWKVVEYKAADGSWKKIGPGTPTPGEAFTKITTIADPPQAVLDAWLEHVDSRHVKVKLPAVLATDPGKQLTKQVTVDGKQATHSFKVSVRVTVVAVSFANLGGMTAVHPELVPRYLQVCTSAGKATVPGLVNTLAHELGHAIGLAYIGGAGAKRWAQKAPIPGIAYGELVHTGQYYVEHDHQGPHCAHGLVEAGKASGKELVKQASYARPEQALKADFTQAGSKHCLMFGEGTPTTATQLVFCPSCVVHGKAQDCSSLDIEK